MEDRLFFVRIAPDHRARPGVDAGTGTASMLDQFRPRSPIGLPRDHNGYFAVGFLPYEIACGIGRLEKDDRWR